MRYAKRTDENHAEIRDGLRAAGYPVLDLSACGHGVPDLAVLVALGRSLFIEVKATEKDKLTEAEQDWFQYNGAHSRVAHTLDGALQAIKEYLETA